jgi:beta-lactamase regulating signal transducer with metallopeptidase domain/uncharacterized GH25 family protein/thiol-disulfide isomerase/thioredoxin
MATALLEHYSLFSIVGRSFVLLLLTSAIAFAYRRRSAAVLHGIWVVGLGGCLAIPIVTLLFPSWRLPLLPPQTAAVSPTSTTIDTRLELNPASGKHARVANVQPAALEPLDSPTPLTGPAPSETLNDKLPSHHSGPTVAAGGFKWLSFTTVICAVWISGSLVALLRLLRQIVAMKHCVRRASENNNAAWLGMRDVAARLLGVRVTVALKSHADALSPMVAGLMTPVVLLPSDANTWSPERRKLVLLHELAHIQRHDVLTQMMAGLACAVYWFNPLAWWGARQMKHLREIACDDAVVIHSRVPANYAQELLDVAKDYRCQQLICTVAMARTSNVEARIVAILSSTRSRARLTKRSARALAAAALLVAAVIGTCQLSSRADESNTSQVDQPAVIQQKTERRTLMVRVLDDQGQPLSGAKVHVSIWEIEGAKDFPNRDYTSDSEGRVEVAIPQQLEILRLWPSKAGYVPQFVNFGRGTHENGRLIPDKYEFRLLKGHRLAGRLVDGDGKPVAGARVQVNVDVSEPIWGINPTPMISTWLAEDESAAVTDGDGRWQITNAPAPRNGNDFEFGLQITHAEFAGDTRWGELQKQQGITTKALRDGTATIKLDRGVAISGIVTGPDGTPVSKGLVVWNDRPYWATGVNETQIDASGHYTTKHLMPGSYPITVLAPGFAPQQRTIEVTRDLGKVDFQLEAGNPIRIKIVDQTGNPVPKAYVGIGEWRKTEAIYNEKHPNVPDSGIPRTADDDGMYEWTWAPADGVAYRISAKGYDAKEVRLVAKQEPHEVVLVRPVTIFGNVLDARSGEPVKQFRVIPVKAYRPDFYSTDFQADSIAKGQDGQYKIQIDSHGQTGNRYRVRIEAAGYRTAFGQKSLEVGDPPLEEDFRLEPAPALVGEVRDADGKPVDNFTVAVGTPTTSPHFRVDRPDSNFGQAFRVRGSHSFELAATFEPQRIRVFNDTGFAEVLRQPKEQIGTLLLEPWASVSGRLMQGNKPIGGEGIYFHPLAQHGLTAARFQDSFYAETDANGDFRFGRLPPTAGTFKAYLGPWRDSPLTSSQAVPLELKPGDHQELSLGGEGATITGRVVATGRSNDTLSKNWSLNYLVSRDQSVQLPTDAEPLSFDPSGPLKAAWLRQPDFQSWVATRAHHFVKLSSDGRLRIHGVQAGEYDLVIQLYEQPAGCLVETIGEKVVPIKITADQIGVGEVGIGDIDVECRIGPRVGTDMRAFEFTDSAGRVRQINDLSGKYVLFHAWATWCAPCVEAMPALKAAVEQHSDKPLTVVGLNIDKDVSAAKTMAEKQGWDWAHNYLGDDSTLMRQLAISSVPAYYLIGPNGKLIGSANQWEQIEELLGAELR